ncbi:MAG: glycosyltransferase family 2 protein [Campylobacteraceae bacterium]|jgi:glycosyltransferase involved in cell wall biosynthesis|nr:glycosyltransferase family 2 protein [Campylobacteraceae bacterium]
MKKIETLTVVITNHNRPKIILPVIESIVNQPLSGIDMDILIIDDASTSPINPNDLNKYGDKVKLHRLNENAGVHAARNIGMAMAKGEFIAVVDDDDTFIPNTLQKALDLITSLDDYSKYPAFQFARTNGSISAFYALADEGYYYKKLLKGDFTLIFNKSVFFENKFTYPEYEELKKTGCEILLFAEMAYKFSIPTWNYNIVKLGNDDTTINRLTNPNNWLLKAKQFANLQELEMKYMRSRGFDKKYPNYYNFKAKGLYTYLLLDNRVKEAREVLKNKVECGFLTKATLFLLSYLPISIVNILLKLYRKRF